jgi:hypothetical protein
MVRERFRADAREVTDILRIQLVTSCGFAALRHPDNESSDPPKPCALSKLEHDLPLRGYARMRARRWASGGYL